MSFRRTYFFQEDLLSPSKMKSLAFLMVIVVMVIAERRYDGHKVIKIHVNSKEDVQTVVNLEDKYELDFWHYPHTIDDGFHVRVPPTHLNSLLSTLKGLNLEVNILIDDVQTHINREKEDTERARRASRNNLEFLNRYYNLSEIEGHLSGLESNEQANVEVELLPEETFEGRRIQLVKISSQSGEAKESIFIDCGMHAREWITPPFCLYAIDQLMSSPNLLEKYTWYIIPVANPDGFHFTTYEQRLWRKNRNRNTPGSCDGVDINRNFDYQFGGPGSSSYTCSDTYRGTGAASEQETKAIKAAILSANPVAYLNVHAYSQLWLRPWGYTKVDPPNVENLDRVAGIATAALYSVHKTNYTSGSPANILYVASGGAFDWAFGEANVEYSYALELRDEGQYGFVLPPDLIEPTVVETWAGVKAMAEAIPERF